MSVEIDEIFDNLEYVASNRGVIRVDGNFMGVSIRLDAFVTNIDREGKALQLQAQGVNVIPFSPDDRIMLRCVLFPKPLQGSVVVVDSQKVMLTVDQLSYVSGTMGKRLHARVQPKTSLQATLIWDEGVQIEASVADISAEGMGLILMGASTSPQRMVKQYDQIQVQFRIGGSGAVPRGQVVVPARVVYVKPLDEGQRNRIGLQLYPDKEASKAIRRYIFDRQTEIYNALSKKDWGLKNGYS